VDVVNRYTTRVDLPAVAACTTPAQIMQFQWLVRQVPAAEAVNRFAVDLVRATRPTDPAAPDVVRRYVQYGASVRATMYLMLAAKARALVMGRYHVTREDVTSLALPVMRHRVLTNYFAESDGMDVDKVLVQLLEHVNAGGVKARAS
jgi:MoxR-like ATPase